MSKLELVESLEIKKLMSPKTASRSNRVQVFVRSDQLNNSGDATNDVYFNIPSTDVVDFRDAYIQMDIKLENQTVEIPEETEFDCQTVLGGLSPPTAGAYQFGISSQFGTQWSRPYDIASNAAAITAGLEADFKQILSYLNIKIRCTQALGLAQASVKVEFYDIGYIPNAEKVLLLAKSVSLVDAAGVLRLCCTNVSVSAPSYPTFEGIRNIVNRLTVKWGGKVITEIDKFSILGNILRKSKPVQYATTGGFIGEGYQNFPITWSNTKRFSLPLADLGIFDHVFPLSLLPSKTLQVVIQLQRPELSLIKQASTAQSYTASNMEIHYHKLTLSKNDMSSLQERVSSGGLIYTFDSYRSLELPVTASTTSQVINFTFSKFKGIDAVLRTNSYIKNPLNEGKLSRSIRSGVQSYRLAVGTRYYPNSNIKLLKQNNDVIQAYNEYTRMHGIVGIPGLSSQNAIAGLFYDIDNMTDSFVFSDIRDGASFVFSISTDPEPRLSVTERHHSSSGVPALGNTPLTLELNDLDFTENMTLNVFGSYTAYLIMSTEGIRIKR